MINNVGWGAFVPQGWKLEYTGWGAADAWARTKELAQLTERLGYDHLWVYDHVETVPRREPTHMFEAFTTLAALAQHTSTIKLGQMVTCAAYRNAGLLAKEAACVDVFSDGRLILGIGAGWYEREYQAYGFPFPRAGARLQILEETGQAGGVVSDGSLYPLLNRLERDGKLVARWSLDEGVSHPRKYYRLTSDGERLLGEMRRMWAEFRATISSIVEREP